VAEYAYPHAALEFAQLNGLSGDVFAYYNWGGFLHWNTDGALRVYIDGRANTIYDDETYRHYQMMLDAGPGALTRLEATGSQLVLWPHTGRGSQLAGRLQRSPRWRLLYRGARGSVFARADLALPADLRVPEDSVSADLVASWNAYLGRRYAVAEQFVDQALEKRPWDHDACALKAGLLRRAGRPGEGAKIIRRCKDRFPSRYLR